MYCFSFWQLIIIIVIVIIFLKGRLPSVPIAFEKLTPVQKKSIRKFLYYLHDFNDSRKNLIKKYGEMLGFDISHKNDLSREQMVANLRDLTISQKCLLASIAFEVINIDGAKESEILYTRKFLREAGVPDEVLSYLARD